MDAEQNPTDPGQQQAAETPEQLQTQDNVSTQEADPGQHEGFKKRIDQLTAQRYEAERAAQAQAAEYQRLLSESNARMASLMEVVASKAVPPLPDPLADLEPEARRRLEAATAAAVTPQMKALQDQVSALTNRLEQQAYQEQEAKFQARVAQEAPQVVEKAKQLFDTWQRAGLRGWTKEDALIYARGQLGVGAPLPPDQSSAQARNEHGQFVASARHVTAAQSAPPPPQTRTVQGLPPDIDRRPLDEQLALYERHLDGKPF